MASAARPPRGLKQVFLPNFVLTLLRTPNQPPSFASFIVPLNFNKLDLRDYLYNAYGVQVLGVRSFVQQQKIRQDKPGARRPARGKWHRPRSIKKMMVELEKPFAWPEVPEKFDAWDKEVYDAAQKDQEEYQQTFNPASKMKADAKQRSAIAKQALALLGGSEKWTPTKSVWEDYGEPVEVETDVTIPRR